MSSELRERARLWAEHDPDPETRAALLDALERGDDELVERCFVAPLTFGTAGLRGPVGPGPAHVNLAVVLRVSWALSRFLLERGLGGRPVLLGYDGRPESEGWARAAAQVHRAAGLRALLFERPGPTPWVAFGVRYLEAAAGVVLTPSHNPRGDAGYKLYDDQGIQIVSPWDTRIAELMLEAPPAAHIARAEDDSERPPDALLTAYQSWLSELGASVAPRTSPLESSERPRIGYTPLHGVGFGSAELAAQAVGVTLSAVPSQVEIDGTFPTTPFPNPEERGTLDELGRWLGEQQLRLGFAHDPDADRFAVVAPRLGRAEPSPLSGDQLGLLLGDLWLEAVGERFRPSPLIVGTIVSSPGLERLAQLHGARSERTLTGFKWLCRPALVDPGFAFAYEEALGSCFALPGRAATLDKDGLAALSVLGAFVSRAREQEPGAIVARRLAALAGRIGLWGSRQKSLRFAGLDEAASFVDALRRNPPGELGGRRVVELVDYREGADARAPWLGAQELLVFELEGNVRVCVRPSGTEPKLKFYGHAGAELARPDDYARLESELAFRLDVLLAELARSDG